MSALPEMPCRELVEVITEYLEGGLGEIDRRRFEEHLANCPPCTEYVRQFRDVISASGRIPVEDLPASTQVALLEAFREFHRH